MKSHVKLSVVEMAQLKQASPDMLTEIAGRIRKNNPGAFHSIDSLCQRVFLVKPETPIPFRSAVYSGYRDSIASVAALAAQQRSD